MKITTLQRAQVPSAPSSPRLKLNLLLGLFLGLVVGALWALGRGTFDTRLKTADDIAAVTAVPVLASIPESRIPTDERVSFDHPGAVGLSESYRQLRTSIQFMGFERERSAILITSAVPGEGKSVTAVNLAVALGETGERVLLMDADLRRPSVAKYLGLANGVGLTSVLIGSARFEEAVKERLSPGGSIWVLTSGPVPPNPSELLESHSFEELMDSLPLQFDAIVIDSPPVNVVADASVLAARLGGAVIVVGAGIARKGDLTRAVHTLSTVQASASGIVLNRARVSNRSGYYGDYQPLPAADTSGVSRASSAARARRVSRFTGMLTLSCPRSRGHGMT